MELERMYELAIEAASAREMALAACRRTKDNAVVERLHKQAEAELFELYRGYNQMIIDKYKELAKNGNA